MLVRHLTGDPSAMAKRATAILAANGQLLLADLVLAECVYVLESFYEVDRVRVAELMRAAIALPSVAVLDARLLLRSLEIYEIDRLDFAEAYLVACAEATGVGAVPVLRPRDRPRRDRRAHRALTRDPSVTRRLTGQRYPLGSI